MGRDARDVRRPGALERARPDDVVQGGRAVSVAHSEAPLGPRGELPVRFETASLGLREGAATIEVWARDDFWRPVRRGDRAVASAPVTIDLTPPKVEVLGATRYVSPGGVQLVAFRVSDAERTDVTVGARAFPSFAYGPPDKDWPPNSTVNVVALSPLFTSMDSLCGGFVKP